MADEAVLRIVLADSSTPAAPAPAQASSAPASQPPPSTSTNQARPSLVPDYFHDLGGMGHSSANIAKNLLKPLKLLNDQEKEKQYLDELLAHKQLRRNHGILAQLKEQGEAALTNLQTYRENTGQVKAPPVTAPPEMTERERRASQQAARRAQLEAARAATTPPSGTSPRAAPDSTAATRTPPPTAVPTESKDDFEKRRQEKLAAADQRIRDQEEEFRRREEKYAEHAAFNLAAGAEPAEVAAPRPDDFEARRAARLAAFDQREREQEEEFKRREQAHTEHAAFNVSAGAEPAEVKPDTSDIPKGMSPEELRAWQAQKQEAFGEDLAKRSKEAGGQMSAAVPSATKPASEHGLSTAAVGEPKEEVDDSALGKVSASKDIARKLVRRREEWVASEAEYKKLKPLPPPTPDPPFDPVEQARKRVETEERRRKVDEEYKKLKPDKPKSALDGMLESLEALRGTLGGTFGRIVGAALDITANLRKSREGADTAGASALTMRPPEGGARPRVPLPILPIPMPTKGAQGTAPTAKEQAPEPPKPEYSKPDAAATQESRRGINPAVVIAVGAAIGQALKSVVESGMRMGDKYGQYNYIIAQQQALAEIRTTLNDIRRAREGSKEIADLIRAQSELYNRWEDIKMSVMRKVLPVVTGVLEVLSALLGIASRTDVDEKDDPTSILLGDGLKLPDL